MEMCEVDCLLCRVTLDINQVRNEGDNTEQIRKYFDFISLKTNGCENFSFCQNCKALLKKFSERHEKLEQARIKLNSSVQDICRVMLQASKDGADFGALREQIVEKGLSLLEKGLRLKKKICGKRGRPRLPLPNFISVLENPRTFGIDQLLYHCYFCGKDFPSVRLSQHRRHKIRDQTEERPVRVFHDTTSSGSEVIGIETERPNNKNGMLEWRKRSDELEMPASSSSPTASEVVQSRPSIYANTGFNQRQQMQDVDLNDFFPSIESTGIEAVEEPGPESQDDMEMYARNLESLEKALSSSPSDLNSSDKAIITDLSASDQAWGNLIQPVQQKNSSSSETSGENGNTKKRKYFVAGPLPDFIFKKDRIFVYKQKHNLYHCSKCNVDIIAPQLNYHKKKHGIGLYSCEVCGKSFKRKQYCIKHVAKKVCSGKAVAEPDISFLLCTSATI